VLGQRRVVGRGVRGDGMSEPAFPQLRRDPWGHYQEHGGMDLRDYFAAKALQAIIAHPGMEPDDCHKQGCSELAYEFADAMLKARES
jgi:hypothetical protein